MLSLLTRFLGVGRHASGIATGRRCRRAVIPMEALEPRLALTAAFEIAFLGNLGEDFTGPTQVYLSGGTNPMTADAWADYVPPQGYIKNTTRNVQFDSQDVLTSPDSATGETYITTSDEYTWLFVAQTVSANWPFDADDYDEPYASGYEAAALTTTPPAGVIKYSANTKNALVTWLAKDADGKPIERYFIRDAWGSLYIMQTSGATEQADVRRNFLSAELPKGWRMCVGFLKKDLTTSPAYDAAGYSQFNIFRTSADDAFQQITWNARGRSIAQQIPDMVIWGGPTANTLRGRRGQNNLMHGAEGDDRIVVLGINDRINGDAGFDTAVFRGTRSRYVVTPLAADGSLVEVRTRFGAERVTTLSNVERLRFQNAVERTAGLGQRFTRSASRHASPQGQGSESPVVSGIPRSPAASALLPRLPR